MTPIPPSRAVAEPGSAAYRRCAMTGSPIQSRSPEWLVLAVLAIAACNPTPATPTPESGAGPASAAPSRAGPVCPVERNPPDPSCAPRPVAGATIVIRDGLGGQVAAAVSGADGAFFVAVGAGDYVMDPLPVEGLLGTAPQQPATVMDGAVTVVQLDYDTGIR